MSILTKYKLSTLAFLLFLSSNALLAQQYEVEVQTNNPKIDRAYLIDISNDKNDTLQKLKDVKGGKFYFKTPAKTKESKLVIIEVYERNENKPIRKYISINPSKKLIINEKDANPYKGDEVMVAYGVMLGKMKLMEDTFQNIQKEFQLANQKGDELKMIELEARNNFARKKYTSFFKDYCTKYMDNPIAPFILFSSQQILVDYEDEVFMENLLKSRVKNETVWHTKFYKLADEKTRLMVGKNPPDFTLKNFEGKEVSLKSLKGKYVLIDFWASWCGPCRKEIPNLKKAYQAFNSKGFEILGVSIDDNKGKWQKAVKEDESNWLHVWDEAENPQNKVSFTYMVESIPRTILLDKEGKILAKNLRGNDVYNTLAKLLN